MKDEIIIDTIKNIINIIHSCKTNVKKREYILTLLKVLNVSDYIIKNKNEDIISNNLINLIASLANVTIITDDNLIIICSSIYGKSLKLISSNGNLIMQSIFEKNPLHYILERIEITFDGDIKSLETSYSLLKKDDITTARGIYKHSICDISGIEQSYRTIFTEKKKALKQLNSKIIQEELKNDSISHNISIDMPQELYDLNKYSDILGEELLLRDSLDKVNYNFHSNYCNKQGFILPLKRNNIYRCKDPNDKIYTEDQYNMAKEELILSGEYKEIMDSMDSEILKKQFNNCL